MALMTFVLLDDFPKLPTGKSNRNNLPEPQYAEADYFEHAVYSELPFVLD